MSAAQKNTANIPDASGLPNPQEPPNRRAAEASFGPLKYRPDSEAPEESDDDTLAESPSFEPGGEEPEEHRAVSKLGRPERSGKRIQNRQIRPSRYRAPRVSDGDSPK